MDNVQENSEQEFQSLEIELNSLDVKVIEIPASTFGTRKIFQNLKPEHTKFVYGVRVLPAQFVGIPDQGALYFKKYHAPGEKFYKDGSYECFSEGGGIYNFYLDALMIHPSEMKKSEKVEVQGLRRRGRKPNPNKPKKDLNAPKGKRGRKPLNPEEKARREAEKAAKLIANPERKRGRKPLPEYLKKTKPVSTGGKRGRPALPEHLKKSKIYVPTGGKRGRPAKNKNIL